MMRFKSPPYSLRMVAKCFRYPAVASQVIQQLVAAYSATHKLLPSKSPNLLPARLGWSTGPALVLRSEPGLSYSGAA